MDTGVLLLDERINQVLGFLVADELLVLTVELKC